MNQRSATTLSEADIKALRSQLLLTQTLLKKKQIKINNSDDYDS